MISNLIKPLIKIYIKKIAKHWILNLSSNVPMKTLFNEKHVKKICEVGPKFKKPPGGNLFFQ